MLTTKELSAIRDSLPKDGLKRIADKTNYDSSTVGKALREPDRFNIKIIEAALEVISEYKEEVKALKNKIKSTTKL
ncbi:MAG: hypothetical protein WBP45_12565 [Daejeonella sp.]